MKNIKLSIVILALISLISAKVSAQVTFAARIENEQKVAANEYQFDIMLYATGSTTSWEMAGFSAGVGYTTAWLNGGTITATLMSGTSDMNTSPNQVPVTINTTTAGVIKIASTSAPGAGSGTVITQAGKRLIRVKIVTSAASGFASSIPLLYWTFTSALYPTSLSAYIGGVNTIIASNSTTTTNGYTPSAGVPNCKSPKYFDGTNWNSKIWASGTTYTTTSTTSNVPTANDEANIYLGTYTGALTCRSLHIASGATATIASGITATIAGHVRNDGTFNAQAGNVVLNGTSQTIAGTGTFSAKNLTVSGGTKTLSAPVAAYGLVSVGSSSTIASGGNLTLKSVAGAGNTAIIDKLLSGASITGNVTVERFIPSVGKKWRFLSSPVQSTNIADWQNEIYITGAGTGNSVGSTNSNGFDATFSNAPSIYWYDETAGSANINSRWIAAAAATDALVPGRGYRVFIRGPRTDGTTLISGTSSTQNAVTLTSVGVPNQGSFSFPNVTYSNPQSSASWCLVGNPYAAPIDWTSSTGWTKTNIQDRVWVWDPSQNSYAIYDASAGVVAGSISQHIPPGQAFWVKTTAASPALACNENVKSTTVPQGLFKTNEMNVLRVKMTFDESNSDQTSIFFRDGYNDAYNETEDVSKLANPTVNISSDFGNNLYAAGNMLSNNYTMKAVPLSVWGATAGEYTLSFTDVESFGTNVEIYLQDDVTGNVTRIDKDMDVKVTIADDDINARKGDNRFKLVFHKNTTGIADMSNVHKLSVFPVPAVDVVTIMNNSLPHGNYDVNVFDQAGRVVFTRKATNMEVFSGLKLNVTDLANGAYVVELLNSKDGFRTSTKIVK